MTPQSFPYFLPPFIRTLITEYTAGKTKYYSSKNHGCVIRSKNRGKKKSERKTKQPLVSRGDQALVIFKTATAALIF